MCFILVFNVVEPFYDEGGVYPLDNMRGRFDAAVEFVQGGFADQANFTLHWVDESAW